MNPQLEETHYWGDIGQGFMAIDIWIGEGTNLNKGYGTITMNLAIGKCFDNPEVHSIIIDPLKSNLAAHRFYKRIGFSFLEERSFNDEDCYIFILKREDWQLSNL